MFKKIVLAAATVATAIAAAPLSTANAGGFSIDTPIGHFSMHDGYGGAGYGHHPHGYGMSCGEARHYLLGEFAKVWKVDCYGKLYTFKVKEYGLGVRYVKFNKYNLNYWFV